MRTLHPYPSLVRRVGIAAAALLCLALPGTAQVSIESADFGGLSARAIGPAVMSGRIAALAVVADDPLTLYVGSAGGGVWKSTDAGTTYRSVFDDHSQSIGAVAVDPSDKEIVWVGTGETWTRNSVSIGTGVYRSTDGGGSWEFKGLGDTERIAAIAIDPTDGATAYVCATGHLWNANEQRGVFRTRDAGETWERVLYVDENTGCSSLSLDPHAPTILYAGMWQFRRSPDFFESGGPGSGVYRSIDGGQSWEELTGGLPEGDKGRIAVAVAPSRPNIVYAYVESEDTGLYRSEDLGASWTEMNSSPGIGARPFYFALIVVDPTDPDRVYKPGQALTVSTDGGRTFNTNITGGFGGTLHSDHHAFWINPGNPHELLIGTDGGIYMSSDRGRTWRHHGNLPVSQFYEVSFDMEWPYNVYGGLQDNGTWTGPSRAIGGIRNRDWRNIASGDGFHAFVDPTNDSYVYVESQGGNLLRYDRRTGEHKQIRPYRTADEEELRFNWNSPIHVGASGALYFGAQYLYRSRDQGDSWERISGDLTTDDPEKQRQEESGGLTTDNTTAENHTTIYTIGESPLDAALVWAGTDDGNLLVTRDGGGSWSDVTANVGVPAGTWVSHVEASPHEAGTAFVTFDGHRTGDMTPYLYRTTDYGESWSAITTEALRGYAHVAKQDPVSPDLLFLGTELGLFISLDGGANWARYSADAGGLPPVSVRDLAIHPRERDLIIATHGRGIWILDDITPLRHLTQEVLESDVALLPSRPAAMVAAAGLQEFPGSSVFIAPNPAEAANIVYYQKRRHLFGDLRVEVYDSEGGLIASVPGGKRRGLNRVEWQMRLPPPKLPPATTLVFAFQGPRVSEGEYSIRLVKGDSSYDGRVSLVPDPRSPHTAEERRLGQQTAMELYGMLEELTYLVDATIGLRDQARSAADSAGADTREAERLTELAERLEAFRAGLVSTSEGGGLTGDEKLREHMGNLFGAVARYDGRPTDSQIARMEALAEELEEAAVRLEALTDDDLASLNAMLVERSLAPLVLETREEWEAREGGGS